MLHQTMVMQRGDANAHSTDAKQEEYNPTYGSTFRESSRQRICHLWNQGQLAGFSEKKFVEFEDLGWGLSADICRAVAVVEFW